MNLDDLERRNSPNRRVISPNNSVAFGADYVKVVKDTPVLSAAEVWWDVKPYSINHFYSGNIGHRI